MDEHKTCTTCGNIYPADRDHFYLAATRPDGTPRWAGTCKTCYKAQHSQYREPDDYTKAPIDELPIHIVRALSHPLRCSCCGAYLTTGHTICCDALRRCVGCSLAERDPVLPQHLDASERRLLRLGTRPLTFKSRAH